MTGSRLEAGVRYQTYENQFLDFTLMELEIEVCIGKRASNIPTQLLRSLIIQKMLTCYSNASTPPHRHYLGQARAPHRTLLPSYLLRRLCYSEGPDD